MRLTGLVSGVFLTLLLVPFGRAQASDLSDFNAAVAEAFGPYRTAHSYLRTQNYDAAAFELEAMIAAWETLESRFLAAAPDAFSDDPAFGPDIERIGDDAQAALAQIDSGDGEAARALILPLHGVMGDLRRRNGVYILQDCLADFSGAMDTLWVYRHDMPDLEQREAQVEVISRIAVVEHEAQRCEAMASEELRQDPEFRRLFDLFYDSMGPIRNAVLERSPARIINVLREWRSAQRLIFFRFG